MFRKSPKPHFEKVHEFVFSDGDRGNSAQSGHVIVKADPEAGRRRSKQNKAVILGVAEAALDEVKDYYITTKKPYKEKFVMAGAYYSDSGVLHAAILEEGIDFGDVEPDGRSLKAIALHQRPDNTYMTMGIATQNRKSWNLQRDMLIPRGVEVIERDIEIPDLPYIYPGVPLV